MSADGTRSEEGGSSRGSTEREHVVFLSFGGSDTHTGIADLENPMGSQLGSQLPDAVVGSKISVPTIFPYAASQWSYGKSTGHVVMPIFDEVEHSHARHLTGSFWEAFFHAHKVCFEQMDVEAGQQGLRGVSFLQGWESEKITNGHQGEFVRIVVETVLSELRQGFRVDVPETLVGINDHVKKLIGLLDYTSNRT